MTENEVIKKRDFVSCSECAKAIYVSKDIFTGKPRYFCWDNILAIDEYGDQILMCDFYGGCDFGERTPPRLRVNNELISNRKI